jgi:exodeoxyribonuclease V alpha subunit
MATDKILIEQLKQLDPKLLSPLDKNFAAFVCRSAGAGDNYALLLAAALVSNASVSRKYTCLDLSVLQGALDTYFTDLSDFGMQTDEQKKILRTLPIPENWCDKLRSVKKAVSVPANGKSAFVPLILEGSLLYIYRDWACEQTLAAIIKERCCAGVEPVNRGLQEKAGNISRYFKKSNLQLTAVLSALSRKFTVISGGPGTGKTTVAAAVGALLLEQNPNLKITLCAPTGKAQARLQESISAQLPELNCSDITKERLRTIPVATIHRLLGGRPGTPEFRYNKHHKLVLDTLIVDEASMISQSLMKALFEALPAGARLVMLGDMQQLASVESGMVLRDFCLAAQENENLSGSVVELRDSHRFAPDRGLGRSTAAIRELPENSSPEAADEIVAAMCNDPSGEIVVQDLPPWRKKEFEKRLWTCLNEITVDFNGQQVPYLSFRNEKSVERAYELFNKFRIICVHRSGLYGSEAVNALAERLLLPHTGKRRSFHKGQPLIINENNYAMELFNGDTGIVWPDENNNLKAFFPASGTDEFRSFDLNLLPAFSSAYAITVHKAQGSGFQQVLVITPSELSPLMTREMIYTALSRAEKKAVFWAKEKILSAALQTVTKRHSNLRKILS